MQDRTCPFNGYDASKISDKTLYLLQLLILIAAIKIQSCQRHKRNCRCCAEEHQ